MTCKYCFSKYLDIEVAKINLRKKRLKSKLFRNYALNLLNEPQNLDNLKTPKLLNNISNKELNKAHKNNLLNPIKKDNKSMWKMTTSGLQCRGQSSLTWLADLWNHASRTWIQKYKGGGEGKRKIAIWNLKTKEIFPVRPSH